MTLTEAQVLELYEALIAEAHDTYCGNPYLQHRKQQLDALRDLALAQIRSVNGMKITIPTAVMEQEFQSYYSKGYKAGKESAEQIRAQGQEPIGWLEWPSLTFRPNGFLERCGATSVQAEPLPLYAAPQLRAQGMVMVPREPTEAMIDAPRYFILYCETPGRTYNKCRKHLEMAGVEIDSWPEWAKTAEGHITKGAVAAIIWAMMLAAAQKGEQP